MKERGTLTLVLGGVRSGKSRFAEFLASALDLSPNRDSVLFVATAQAFDSEMRTRIEKHQETRSRSWQLLEKQRGVGAAILAFAPFPKVVLLDCLPLLITNIMCDPTFEKIWEKPLESHAMESVQKSVDLELDKLLEIPSTTPSHMIVVSGEVGLGLVPENAMGRAFRDLLGWANQRLALRAHESYFLAAGHAVPLKQWSVSIDSVAASLRQSITTTREVP